MKRFIENIVGLLFIPALCFLKKTRGYFLKHVSSNDETLNLILEGKSLGRFGDGEFMIIKGKNLKQYQDYSHRLKNKLLEVLQSDNKGFIIGIPENFNGFISSQKMKSRIYWSQYILRNYFFLKRILNKHTYVSSQVTRFYINSDSYDKSKKIFKKWMGLFKNKNILIVEGSKTGFGNGNDLLSDSKSVLKIICPYLNSFDKYDEILEEVNNVIANVDIDLVLISLGPTATILSYDIYKNTNIQCVDIGNLDLEYNWFLNKSTNRTQIAGKRVYELDQSGSDNNDDGDASKSIETFGTVWCEIL